MEKFKIDLKTKLIIASVILILFLLMFSINRSKKVSQTEQRYEALTDTLVSLRDENNHHIAKIKTIEDKLKNFLKLKSNDDEIKKLQEEVKKYKKQLNNKGSATVISITTKIDTLVITKLKIDTIKLKDTITTVTSYNSEFNNKWIDFKVNSSYDSTDVNITIRNEYAVIIGEESRGLFKRAVPVAIVSNKNPYSEIQQLRTFEVKVKKPGRFSIGPIVGYGTGDDFKFKPFIGVGFMYSLIKF